MIRGCLFVICLLALATNAGAADLPIGNIGLPHPENGKYQGRQSRPPSDRHPSAATLKSAHAVCPVENDAPFRRTRGLQWLQDSAEYRALTLAMYREARERVEAIASKRRRGDPPWVVMIDADETFLDNSQFQLEQQKHRGDRYHRDEWRKWVARQEARLIPGAGAFFARVLSLGGKIAVITNRDADQAEHTVANMRKLGLNTDPASVCVLGQPKDVAAPRHGNNKDLGRQAGRDGTARVCWSTKEAAESWGQPQDVVMHIGDKVHDFPGITQAAASAVPEIVAKHLGRDWFLLPNPVYGSWQGR